MKVRSNYLAAITVTVLLLACVAAWQLTRDSSTRTQKKAAVQVSKVDDRLLITARQLAAVADTAAEQDLAIQAMHFADQELDQDFATSIREAAASAPPSSGPLHDLAVRLAQTKARVDADQQRIAQLTKDAATESAAADKLEMAKAQLALDQDELDDSQQDLARQGGDERANLQRALQEHEAVQQKAPVLARVAPAEPPTTLWRQLQLWFALNSRQDQVEAAREAADRKASVLAQTHKALEGNLAPAPETSSDEDDEEEDASDIVARLRRLSDQRKTLAELDKRIQSTQQLSTVYQSWSSVLSTRRRDVLHLLLGSFVAVLAIVLGAILAGIGARRLLAHQTDRRRLHQLRVIISIAIQALALVLMLLVIFGAPTQMPTIIGLATAGLTVVLKDFIVAFFGWFVLMGRNGIRIGDWVEINGVGGEVIEVGVLRTVLLEMGNWINTGHPTGRRVAFVNNFAIEGHFFNFSTTGQWLWDELQVTIPLGGDPYALAERIRATVEEATAEEARLAEEDWERVTHQYGTRTFSARPASDLRPGTNGLIVNVRYITRAPLRYEVKSRLFEAIVDLLHKSAAKAST